MNYVANKSDLRVVGTRPIRPDGVEKVTGRAAFGADFSQPGMLAGRVKRSPYPHARIVSIDTSKAEKLAGVKAVITAADFPEIPSEEAFVGEGPMNFRDLSRNCMARDKVLYEGHVVAAVCATSDAIAEAALALIDVVYEELPRRWRRGRRCCMTTSTPPTSLPSPPPRRTSPRRCISCVATLRPALPRRM
jgi:CO/xanthine dehydrogenase Mo-binding subunit